MFILLLYLEVLVTNPYDAALSSARIEEEKKNYPLRASKLLK